MMLVARRIYIKPNQLNYIKVLPNGLRVEVGVGMLLRIIRSNNYRLKFYALMQKILFRSIIFS